MLEKSALPFCPPLPCCWACSSWQNQLVNKCQTISRAFQSHRRQEPPSASGKRLSAVPPQTGVLKSSSEAFLIVLCYVVWFWLCSYSRKTSSCTYGRRPTCTWHKCSQDMPKHCAQALVPFQTACSSAGPSAALSCCCSGFNILPQMTGHCQRTLMVGYV